MEDQKELLIQSMLVLGTSGMILLTSAIIVFVYLYQRKLIKRKLAFQEIENMLKQQELKSTYAILEGQDIERNRIATELHDNMGSLLVTLNMFADSALRTDNNVKKNELLNKITDLSSKATIEVRNLSHRLDSTKLQHFGLKAALNDLTELINQSNKAKITGEINIDEEPGYDLSINIYRITQELFNNALKHSKATHINFELHKIKNDYLSLIYHDNGVGFNKERIKNGLGIENIKSRVDKMNGEISIESGSSGVNIIIEIPLI